MPSCSNLFATTARVLLPIVRESAVMASCRSCIAALARDCFAELSDHAFATNTIAAVATPAAPARFRMLPAAARCNALPAAIFVINPVYAADTAVRILYPFHATHIAATTPARIFTVVWFCLTQPTTD